VAGGAYVFFAFCCGLAGGLVGRYKGSSFFIWFVVCLVLPPALIAAVLYRYESDEPDSACPSCGKPTKFYEAICTRCGTELDPGYTEQSAPVAERPA
jgi:hypothetical protein